MFKLKRLEITGFKSFADHTDLIFTGDGITAVVGPNGCGKSNVADAIAWVLGEQRVKHLRGGEMKDVIFQGSRNRPPSGMAEVVLHLVRDEIVEHEPDIEDIDSTLEQIDEQSDAFEEFGRADRSAAGRRSVESVPEADSRPEASCRPTPEAIASGTDLVDRDPASDDGRSPTQNQRHLIIGIGASAAIWRLSLRRAKPFRLRAVSIVRARANICSTIVRVACATFRISSRAPDWRAVTTRLSNRVASARFFRPSRWTAARSSKRRPASPSFACASAPPKRVWNPRAQILAGSPTSFPKLSAR